MFKKKNYLALGAVTLVAVLIFSLPHARNRPPETRHRRPVFAAVRPRRHRAATARRGRRPVLSRRELLQEIENLRRENQQLKVPAVAGCRDRA